MKNIEELSQIIVNHIPADHRPTENECIEFLGAKLEDYFNEK